MESYNAWPFVFIFSPSVVFFLKNIFILFIYYFWLCWIFVAARELSLGAASGGYSLLLCAIVIFFFHFKFQFVPYIIADCLSPSGLLSQTTTDGVPYEQ